MALTPLVVTVQDEAGVALAGAEIEAKYARTGTTSSFYNRDGGTVTGPYFTDATGMFIGYLPNGLFEWRHTPSGGAASDWVPFRAYAGYGAEGAFATGVPPEVDLSAPPAYGSLATLDTITVPSFGIDDAVGRLHVTLDFAFNHMYDLLLVIQSPMGTSHTGGLWDGLNLADTANDYAFDGTVTLGDPLSGGSPYDAPMVSASTYAANTDVLRGDSVGGVWALRWSQCQVPAFSGYAGTLHDWSIEFIPE